MTSAIDEWFSRQVLTPKQRTRADAIYEQAKELAKVIAKSTLHNDDQRQAMMRLRETVAIAVDSIALEGTDPFPTTFPVGKKNRIY